MQKQVIYPNFIPRLFSVTIDLSILAITLSPIINIISKYIFIWVFQDFFQAHNVDMSNNDALAASMAMQAFVDYLTLESTLKYSAILITIHTCFMGGYFVFFWRKFGATPGKMIMRMKIVDADDQKSKLSTYRCIRRFFGYITALLSLLSVHFNKRGMTIHDKMANSVVIKA
ncbi:RDD family protein [Rickettsiaceae bacterium]|nr:RDD family protein [Rickettsiaceae bacterium]